MEQQQQKNEQHPQQRTGLVRHIGKDGKVYYGRDAAEASKNAYDGWMANPNARSRICSTVGRTQFTT